MIEAFKKQIHAEIAAIQDNSPKHRNTCAQLALLEKANSIEELVALLNEIKHPVHIKLAASSPAIHALILDNPDAFIAFFSRDNIRAIIHQAAKLGHVALVTSLVEKIKLDVVKEKVAPPHGSYTSYKDGTYAFHDAVPLCHVVAQSGNIELMRYILSFYDLAAIDKTSTHGDLQIALTIAAEHNGYDIVDLLLSSGVNVNSVRKVGESTTALYYAVLYAPKQLSELLVERGATISYLNKFHAVSRGKLDIVMYFVSKGVDFHKSDAFDAYWLNAFESGSVSMARYFIETLKIAFYKPGIERERKKYIDTSIVKKAVHSGSIDMLQYIEHELNIPVTKLIQDEMQATKHYHHMYGEFIVLEAVCSYNVNLLKFLFETKGLTPKKEHLSQLLGYAYDNGLCLPQHRKFATHAYVYSFVHENQDLSQLLKKVSNTEDLSGLSNQELFMLYADYTKQFKEREERFARGILFRDNSTHLANEIAKRKLNQIEWLDLAKSNPNLAADVLYFLTVSAEGYPDDEVMDLLKDPVFDPNCNLDDGSRPLHLAIRYRRVQLVGTLLLSGADPDMANHVHRTPITMMDPNDKDGLDNMLKHSKSLVNSLSRCMQISGSLHLVPMLQHMQGNIVGIDLLDWLKLGRKASGNVYNALCHLNPETYALAKAQITAMNDTWWTKELELADGFRNTGIKPQEIVEGEDSLFRAQLFSSLFGSGSSCCGGGGLRLLAAAALLGPNGIDDLLSDEEEEDDSPVAHEEERVSPLVANSIYAPSKTSTRSPAPPVNESDLIAENKP